MSMSVYSVSYAKKYTSTTAVKKYIQVYVSNFIKHKSLENTVGYPVTINFQDIVWFMKLTLIVSCLKGMAKTPVF